MKKILILTAAVLVGACSNAQTSQAPQVDSVLASIKKDYPVSLANIAEDVWVHTTNYRLPGQAPIPSNGLVVVDGDDVILVDGAWGELATLSLLEHIKDEIGKPVTKMVVTHHHADRVSGVDAAEREGIQVLTHPDTPVLAARSGQPVPNTSVASLKEAGSRSKAGAIEIAYPGHGHAPDNLVVYVPKAKVLYAGCAVRGAGSKTLGNIEDADLKVWAQSLAWTKATYGEAVTVVPGHGKGADMSLIDATMTMIAAQVNKESDTKSADKN